MAESCTVPSGATGHVSNRQLVINLVAGGLGTGMLSLPWSMAGASVFPGLAMTLCVVALNAWTIMILVQAAEEQQVFDLGALLGRLPGQMLPGRLGRRVPSVGIVMQCAINTMVWIVMMGSLVSYLIVIHDSMRPFLKDTPLGESRKLLISAAALIVLPLCFLDQRYLSLTSTVAFLVNIYLIGLLVALFGQRLASDELPSTTCLIGYGRGSAAMLAALGTCVIIQMCVLPMYEELEDRSPKKFRQALLTAFSILAGIFSLFACLGYLTFGADVNPNVLLNLPDSPLAVAAQVGVVAVVAAIYPIMVLPMLAPVKKMSLQSLAESSVVIAAIERKKDYVVPLVTCMIVFISYVGALYIESLAVVNVVSGALSIGTFTALSPSLVGLWLLQRPLPMPKMWAAAMYILLVLGLVTAYFGLVFDDNYKSELTCSVSRWGAVQRTQAFLA